MTHQQLVKKAATWCKSKCGVVITEMVCLNVSGEIPDCIGFTDGGTVSFLIECKASRSDFKADSKKMFRKNGFLGMGDFRFYLAPKGMINIEELPKGWGLIEVKDIRSRCITTHNPFGKGNIYSRWARQERASKAR